MIIDDLEIFTANFGFESGLDANKKCKAILILILIIIQIYIN